MSDFPSALSKREIAERRNDFLIGVALEGNYEARQRLNGLADLALHQVVVVKVVTALQQLIPQILTQLAQIIRLGDPLSVLALVVLEEDL